MSNYNGVYNYEDISSVEDYNLFVKNVIGVLFFQGEEIKVTTFGDKFYITGPVVFRQVRTKETECSEADSFELDDDVICYYDEYDNTSKETDDIDGGDKLWNEYQDSDETGITGTVIYSLVHRRVL